MQLSRNECAWRNIFNDSRSRRWRSIFAIECIAFTHRSRGIAATVALLSVCIPCWRSCGSDGSIIMLIAIFNPDDASSKHAECVRATERGRVSSCCWLRRRRRARDHQANFSRGRDRRLRWKIIRIMTTPVTSLMNERRRQWRRVHYSPQASRRRSRGREEGGGRKVESAD